MRSRRPGSRQLLDAFSCFGTSQVPDGLDTCLEGSAVSASPSKLLLPIASFTASVSFRSAFACFTCLSACTAVRHDLPIIKKAT